MSVCKVSNNTNNNLLIDANVINFLNIISSEDIINKFLDNMQIDNKRMQISKINKKRIVRAEEILFQLQNEIQENNLANIEPLSQEYDRYIPYKKYIILDF